jgi:hypothetical protein
MSEMNEPVIACINGTKNNASSLRPSRQILRISIDRRSIFVNSSVVIFVLQLLPSVNQSFSQSSLFLSSSPQLVYHLPF